MEGLWEGVEGILIMMMMILRRLLAALDIDIDIPYVYTYRLPLFYVGRYSLGANASPSSMHCFALLQLTTRRCSSLSLPPPPPLPPFETVSFPRCCPHLPASATAEHAGLSNSRSPKLLPTIAAQATVAAGANAASDSNLGTWSIAQ